MEREREKLDLGERDGDQKKRWTTLISRAVAMIGGGGSEREPINKLRWKK